MVKGIGGKANSIGWVTIRVSFKHLDVIIDVYFLFISEDIPTLLSRKDLVDNGSDVSIKGWYVSLKEGRHPLAMENYFPVHRWNPTDIPYALYA